MNIKLQIVVAIILVTALIIIVNMVRKRQLELRYALAWLIVGVGTLIFDCFPDFMKWLSKLMGIATPSNMLFFCGFVFALVIIFILTLAVSRMSIRIKQLAQELALLEKKCRDNEKSEKNIIEL